MSRYIDADKLLKTINENVAEAHNERCVQLIEAILYAPTADVEEVRHGEWIEKDDGWGGVLYTCSVCHCDWTTIDGTPFENNMRYCPECGAKMDGGRSENGK
jgi:rubrerythrin